MGRVFLIVHELKTDTLLEVDEELLRGVKGFGGWISFLYQNILSNVYTYYLIETDEIHIYIYYIFKKIHTNQGKT